MKMKELGKIISNINLNGPISESVIEQIKQDVNKYRLLIFKNQGKVSGDRQVEISEWFGNLESTFYKHPKSPHPDVFRVSNDEEEGCTNVAFIPLNELINSLSSETRDRWERLWMVSDRRGGIVHPIIYPHPVTRLKTLCFHLGMTTAFLWDKGSDKERMTEWSETVKILKDMYQEIVKDDGKLIYSHKWEEGDFIISDNLALGHEATPESQYPREEVGLRILHRTTVEGTNEPCK